MSTSEVQAPEAHLLPDGGWCPNNPTHPLLVYLNAIEGEGEALAEAFESLFAAHGWPPAWRYTIYDYPHYHSTSHEVIGVFRGSARVRLGDEAGFTAHLHVGDVLIIPAGVSHQLLDSSDDFCGVGAYPAECDVDEQRLDYNDKPGSLRRIAALPVPPEDPLHGENGPLVSLWPAS